MEKVPLNNGTVPHCPLCCSGGLHGTSDATVPVEFRTLEYDSTAASKNTRLTRIDFPAGRTDRHVSIQSILREAAARAQPWATTRRRLPNRSERGVSRIHQRARCTTGELDLDLHLHLHLRENTMKAPILCDIPHAAGRACRPCPLQRPPPHLPRPRPS